MKGGLRGSKLTPRISKYLTVLDFEHWVVSLRLIMIPWKWYYFSRHQVCVDKFIERELGESMEGTQLSFAWCLVTLMPSHINKSYSKWSEDLSYFLLTDVEHYITWYDYSINHRHLFDVLKFFYIEYLQELYIINRNILREREMKLQSQGQHNHLEFIWMSLPEGTWSH